MNTYSNDKLLMQHKVSNMCVVYNLNYINFIVFEQISHNFIVYVKLT